jgi:hypothetical protein
MNTKDYANSGYYPLELALLQGESRVFKQLLLLGGNSFDNWENKKFEICTEEDTSEFLPSLSSSSSSLPTPSFSPLSSSSSPLIPPTLSSSSTPPPFTLLMNKSSRNILHTAVIGGQISSLNYLLKWIYETETDGKTVKNEVIIRGEKEISIYTPKENIESNANKGKSKNDSEKVEQNTNSPSLSRLLGGQDGDGRTPLELAEHLNKVLRDSILLLV